jgi:hypothetical protein
VRRGQQCGGLVLATEQRAEDVADEPVERRSVAVADEEAPGAEVIRTEDADAVAG